MNQPSTTQTGPGLDHSWFGFRTLRERGAFSLPDAGRLAVTVSIVVQDYELAGIPPFSVPGTLDRPFPDIGSFSQRQVGTTDGLWRLVDTIEHFGIPASFVIEQQALGKITDIHDVLRSPRHAVVASGRNATTLHTPSMNAAEEEAIIRGSIAAIASTLGRTPIGWRSPYCALSERTLELLPRAGIRYLGDLANDDRPYELSTPGGPLVAVPMNHFFSDLHLIQQCRQTEHEFFESLERAARWLCRETSAGSALVLPIVLHPWLSGTPHRADRFTDLLKQLTAMDGVRFLNTDTVFHAYARR